MDNINWCNKNNHPQTGVSYYFIMWECKVQIQQYFQMKYVVLKYNSLRLTRMA